MKVVAQIIDGNWVAPEQAPRPSSVVPLPPTLDALVQNLASILTASQHLSHDDQGRLRDFVLAAGSVMMARTRLDECDQKRFETALRDAAARWQS
jgi:hypothetical protein